MIKTDKEMFFAIRFIENIRLNYPDDEAIQQVADYVYCSVVAYDRITSEGRIGEWTTIASGKRFWLLDPRPEDIYIKDIAHSLARICRYNGQIKSKHYSVGQHCVIGSWEIEPKYAVAFLLHDAQESYVGDLITPLKHCKGIKEAYSKIEDKIQDVIFNKYRVIYDEETAKAVKLMDNRMLAQEFRNLTDYRLELGSLNYKPLSQNIHPWSVQQAEEIYIERFDELVNLQK